MAYTKEQREAKKKIEEQEMTSKNVEQNAPSRTIYNLPPHTQVRVKNSQYGELIYINKNTGYKVSWYSFGDVNNLSLDELTHMRNSQRRFYEDNWISIVGFIESELNNEFSVEDILEYLQVRNLYSGELCPDTIDDLFKMPPSEIENRLAKMSNGVKNTVIVRANELIMNGQLDSLKAITAIEKALNCELSRP